MTYHAKVISGGKVVIPVDIRRELGFATAIRWWLTAPRMAACG